MLGMDLGALATSCVLGFSALLLLYWFLTRNYDYWEKRGVPFVKPKLFSGSLHELSKKPTQEVELDRYLKYGRIYGSYEGTKPILTVAEPELLRNILVKDFPTFHTRRMFFTGDKFFDKMVSVMKGDDDWKRIRTIITPTFTTGKIKRMLGIFKDCSKTVVKNFRAAAMEGKPVDAKRLYGAFTMDVIASTAFSTKIDSHNDPDNPFVQNASKAFEQKFNWRLMVFFFFPVLAKFIKVYFFPPGVTDFFKRITVEIIEQRKRTGQTRNDFLQLLMDTAKEVEEYSKTETPEKDDIASNYGIQEDINSKIFKSTISKKLSMDELVAQCVIFFIGGYDSTASTLSFATYFLALNPGVQDRLRTEVDDVLKESDGELTHEAIHSMKYLDNVISETLRMYPPLVRNERTAFADYKLGDTGLTIPQGMVVGIPIYAMHRDPKVFPDPEKFDPDRFNPENSAKRHPYSYLPFGAGPRNCVAMRFALMEVKVCLAYVISNFIIKRCPETKVPLEFGLRQFILKPEGIILDLESRTDSPLVE